MFTEIKSNIYQPNLLMIEDIMKLNFLLSNMISDNATVKLIFVKW